MSAAGTPSTDPWVMLAREKARYEEQFKSLKPTNGIVTGDQAKGFFLQSQLPPLTLGQIWALADTDMDGKMDINEFSIACKLINLKLRGFEIPKGLPPSLIASLKINTPPAIPPLPNAALVNAPPRPELPKVAPMPAVQSQPLISQIQPVQQLFTGISTAQPLISSLPTTAINTVPPLPMPQYGGASMAGNIPTGIVPPMQTNVQSMQPLIGGLSEIRAVPQPPTGIAAPLVGDISLTSPTAAPLLPGFNQNATVAGNVPAIPSMPLAGPGASSTPRASVTSLDRTHSIESLSQADWAVPHQTKLKYTQIFNTTDRLRTGYLSGAQARNVMVQTKLPQSILAQIWALSDMDGDGRLGSEEFVLAMHLCEQASLGNSPPAKLPPELIPPSFRRTGTRTASISSQGSVATDLDPASTLLQNSFEDKRKENFEKGQAELERRRKALLDQQRQEREERERKEREEQEKKEKARQEAERKRLDELERQMREQQEKERQLEEERKRQAEQREAARKEMERQRQLEWEKQRLQELQNQRQREQENVLKLKAKNQSLTIELTSLNDQVRELSQKICDTRLGVSNVKTTIDGMRSTRDSQMQEMSQLKNKLKEQNAKLLQLSHDKAKLESKNKMGSQDPEQARLAYENKEITIKNLKTKIEDMQMDIEGKLSDIENNNSQLSDLRSELQNLLGECEQLYSVYEVKKNTVLEIKSVKGVNEYDSWKNEDAWGNNAVPKAGDWPVDSWGNTGAAKDEVTVPGVVKYRAIYEFVARNNDEISFQPGDIINVPMEQTGEPGWLAGEIRGSTGWFPETYVEPIDGVGVRDTVTNDTIAYPEESEATRLEGIAEVPEAPEPQIAFEPTQPVAAEVVPEVVPEVVLEAEPEAEPEYYIANYPYQSQEQGDLTFNAGEVIAVVKKVGDWWTGKIGENIGIFPSNYVQKVDVSSSNNANATAATAAAPETALASTGVSAEAVQSALESVNAQADNEVSQINQTTKEVPLDAAIQSGAQVVKGKKPEIASVIAPYQSTSPEQLSLARGQLIMIRKKTDSGWWEGELQAKGRKRQVGWFPASYVKVLNSTGKISGRSTPASTTRMQQEIIIDKVIALYPYSAGNPDELTFAKDDIISVTAREEEAWWRGELNGVSGLFPSNYVSPLQQQSFSPQDKKRQECINELIQTEKAYVQDMSIVHDVFEKPLRESKLIPIKEIDEIFVNWQDILVCNKNFMEDLVSSKDEPVGSIICRHLPRMTAYITFCGKQLDSAALLQKLTETSTAFRELVKKCQNNFATKGMPLSSFLIKPMQRITRYPLLISKIKENTPSDHPDYKNLEEALRIAERFLSCVNENVRLKETQERMDWLQQYVQTDLNITFNGNTNKLGPRQILHFGLLIKVKTGKELIGFLFNDFFMLVQASKSLGSQFTFQRNSNLTYKMYKQPILIQHLSTTRGSPDSIENGTDLNRLLNIHDEKTSYRITLLATSVNDCSLWMKRIENAKESLKNATSSNLQNKRKTLLFGKWLFLTMVEGIEIKSSSFMLYNKNRTLKRKGKFYSENVYCKVTLGKQEHETDLAKETFSNGNSTQNGIPQIPTLVWNHSMQFQLRNIEQEVLNFVVFERNELMPDEFLGKAELKLKDILQEARNHNGPITKKLILHQVESGELVVKLDVHLFDKF